MSNIYAGPGKVSFNSVVLVAEGDAGTIRAVLNEDTRQVVGTFYGYAHDICVDQVAEISLNPFDDWSLLATLFPFAVVHTAGSVPGSLAPGGNPHGASASAQKALTIWTPDSRLYTFNRAAITRHPSINLGPDRPLFGDVGFTAISSYSATTTLRALGAAGCICAVTNDPVSGTPAGSGAEPTPAIDVDNIIRGVWTGVWTGKTGFTTAVEGEDGWSISCDASYNFHKSSGRTLSSTFNSVRFMARCRPYGPSHKEVLDLVGAHTLGQKLGAADLTLTGPGSKTITLKNCEIQGMGFDFGGSSLGQGEIGFVTSLTTGTPGTLDPFVVFSS